jgi:hypothetical protein
MTDVNYANYVVGHAEILYKYNQMYGPIYRSWAGSRGIVNVSFPEAAEVRNLLFKPPRLYAKIQVDGKHLFK